MYWFAIPNIGSVLKGLSQVYNLSLYISRLLSISLVNMKILTLLSMGQAFYLDRYVLKLIQESNPIICFARRVSHRYWNIS